MNLETIGSTAKHALESARGNPAAPGYPHDETQRISDEVPMRTMLGISEDALDGVMAAAYQLYEAGRYAEVDVLCRGLIAVDHTYWWSYSLHAATLRRLGRLDQALRQLEVGLRYEPREPKLLAMHAEICLAVRSVPADCSGQERTTSRGFATHDSPLMSEGRAEEDLRHDQLGQRA